jgi:hypothetical protein
MSRPHTLPRRLALAAVPALFLALAALSVPARAADAIDYVGIAKNKVLTCLHPTVKPNDATAEITKPTTTSGDTATTRVKIFYSGLVRKNSVELEILVRQAGSIRQMRVNVLADTATEVGSCNMVKNWVDF